MNAVALEGIERRFATTPVLRGLDLQVADGERVAVLGDNGAGKTTLLRVIAGLLRPSAGTAVVLGASPRDPRVRRRVGLLGHAPFLYGRLTALENLRFWGRLYDAADVDERSRRLLAELGLDTGDRRPVAAYSQGMRQRVGLARALVHDPELLLLDEPFANLDRDGVAVAERLVADRTLVFTTHLTDVARELATRTLRLEAGRLRDEAAP